MSANLTHEVVTTRDPEPTAPIVPEPAVVELVGMAKRFGDVVAVDDVSIAVPAGQVLGLLGHNGAGKSTIARLIAGLLRPDVGVVTVGGRDPATDGAAVRRHLGVLPSTSFVDDRLTGRQNLDFASGMFGVPTRIGRQRANELLERFELTARADDLVSTYSAGMRQRLALSRVLLPEPDVLILDEPTSAMDPVAARDFVQLLGDLARREGRAIVLCTHDLPEAAAVCDEVVVLAKGAVIARGAPTELTAAIDVPVTVTVAPEQLGDAVRVVRDTDPQAAPGAAGEVLAPRLSPHAIPTVVEQLVAAGVAVYGVSRRPATLEDVYFDLHTTLDHTEEVR